MFSEKSPISTLQELTLQKHLPVPQYNFSQQGLSFKCTAIVNNHLTCAVAQSKKHAKHLSAENMLMLLKNECTGDNHKAAMQPVDVTVQDDLYFNAVGKLNELTQRELKVFPEYVYINLENGLFVIGCKLQSYFTEGRASTKKTAKQLAAMKMLERFGVSHQQQLSCNNAESNEKVIALYKTLSNIKSGTTMEEYTTTRAVKTQNDVKVPETFKSDVSEEQLINALKEMGVTYKISTFQKQPLVLGLQASVTGTCKTYSFLHGGKLNAATKLDLLKKAVSVIRYLDL